MARRQNHIDLDPIYRDVYGMRWRVSPSIFRRTMSACVNF